MQSAANASPRARSRARMHLARARTRAPENLGAPRRLHLAHAAHRRRRGSTRADRVGVVSRRSGTRSSTARSTTCTCCSRARPPPSTSGHRRSAWRPCMRDDEGRACLGAPAASACAFPLSASVSDAAAMVIGNMPPPSRARCSSTTRRHAAGRATSTGGDAASASWTAPWVEALQFDAHLRRDATASTTRGPSAASSRCGRRRSRQPRTSVCTRCTTDPTATHRSRTSAPAARPRGARAQSASGTSRRLGRRSPRRCPPTPRARRISSSSASSGDGSGGASSSRPQRPRRPKHRLNLLVQRQLRRRRRRRGRRFGRGREAEAEATTVAPPWTAQLRDGASSGAVAGSSRRARGDHRPRHLLHDRLRHGSDRPRLVLPLLLRRRVVDHARQVEGEAIVGQGLRVLLRVVRELGFGLV